MALIYRGATIEDRKHEVVLSTKKFAESQDEILTWCYENFGNRHYNGLWDITGQWSTSKTVHFTFVRETDAAAFKLRWK